MSSPPLIDLTRIEGETYMQGACTSLSPSYSGGSVMFNGCNYLRSGAVLAVVVSLVVKTTGEAYRRHPGTFSWQPSVPRIEAMMPG